MNYIEHIRRDYGDEHPVMKILDSKFAEEFNKRMSDYWVLTGRNLNIEETILDILIEKFDSLKSK